MSYTVALPDGRTVEFPDEVPHEKAAEIIRQQLGGGPGPQGGFFAAMKDSTASALQGLGALDAQLGLRSPEVVEQEQQHLQEYRDRTFKPEAQGWTETPWAQFKETLGGSIPQMAATMAGGFLGGPLGAGAVDAAMFTGSNLQRQQQEGQPTNLGAAAAAAVPQAALDVIGLKMIPGIRNIFANAGREITNEEAKRIATQTLGQKALDYAKHTGTAIPVEGLTEAAQQALERLQAGLPLNDEKAQDEYVQNFVGGVALAGALGPFGRATERGAAKRQAATAIRAEEAAANQQRMAQEQNAADSATQSQTETAFSRQQDQEATDFVNESLAKMRELGDLADVPKPEQPPSYDEWKRASDGIGPMLEQAQQRQKDLANAPIEERIAAAQQVSRLQKVKDQIAEIGKTVQAPPQAQIDKLNKAIQKKIDKGESPEKELQQLAELTKGQDTQTGDLFSQEQTSDEKLGEEMGQAREEAAARRQKVEQEIEALRRIGDHSPDNPEYARALHAAMGRTDNFVPPQGNATTLHLPPDKAKQQMIREGRQQLAQPSGQPAIITPNMSPRERALAQQEALRNLRALKQKQGDTSPMGEWMQAQRQRMIDERTASLAQDNQADALQARLSEISHQQDELRQQITQAQARDVNNVGTEESTNLKRQLQQLQLEQQAKQEQLATLRPDQKQTKLGQPLKGSEPPINLSDESDKRIAPLIERLLGNLQGQQGEPETLPGHELAPAQQPQVIPVKRSLGPPSTRPQGTDSGSILAAMTGTARVTGERPPALDGFDTLARLRDNVARIQELNDAIKRAGNPKDPAKLQAKQDAVAELAQLKAETQQLQQQYNRAQQPAQEPMGPPVGENTNLPQPGQMNLPGIPTKPFQPKAPPEGAAKQAQSALVQAESRLEALRKAEAQSGTNPKYFREAATQRQIAAEKIRNDPAQFQTKAGQDTYAKLTREAQHFLQMERMAAAGGNNYRDALRAQREQAQQEVDRLRGEIENVRRREGAAKQQRAANENVDVGDLEAARIVNGDTSGYENYRGKKLKNYKAPPPTPLGPLAKAAKMLEQARDRLHQLQQRGVAAHNELTKALSALIDAHYSDARAKEITKELHELAEKGVTPLAKVAESLNGEPQAVQQALRALVQADEQSKEGLQRARAAADEAYLKWDFKRKVGASADSTSISARGDYEAKVALGKAVTEYNRNHADRLEAERLLGERLRQALIDNTAQLQGQSKQLQDKVQAAKQRLAETVAERQKAEEAFKKAQEELRSMREAERNKPRLEAQKNLESTLAEDRAAKEAAIRAQTGEGLPGVRAERDTTSMTPVENALKRQLADANTKLDRLEAPIQRIDELQKQLKQLRFRRENRAYDQAEWEQDARDASNIVAEITKLQREVNQDELTKARERVKNLQQQVDGLYDTAPKKEQNLGRVDSPAERDIIAARRDLAKAQAAQDEKAIKAAQEDLDNALAYKERENKNKTTLEDTRRKVKQAVERWQKADTPEAKAEIAKEVEQLRSLLPEEERPRVVEGVRLPERTQGPLVRAISGANKKATQSGVKRLLASGMRQEDANNIAIYTLKSRIAGAEGAAKEKLQKEFNRVTEGLSKEQVKQSLAEGERLIGLGPTAKIIAARERFREAETEAQRLRAAVKGAKGVEREVLQDKLEKAEAESDAAEVGLKEARAEHEKKGVEKVRKAAPIEEDLEELENAPPSDIPEVDEEDTAPYYEEDYARGQRLPYTPEMQAAVDRGDLMGALREIANNSTEPLLRTQARTLLDFVGDTRLTTALKGTYEKALGMYSASINEITMVGKDQNTLVHEATHAATMRAIDTPDERLTAQQRKAKAELEAMRKYLARDTATFDQYGVKDLREFAAEMQSNPRLREAIGERKWYGGSNFITRFFNRLLAMLGFKDGHDLNTLASHYINQLNQKAVRYDYSTGNAYRTSSAEYDVLIGRPKGAWAAAKDLGAGNWWLKKRMEYADMRAPFEEGINRAEKEGKLSHQQAVNALYHARFGDQVNQAVAQFISHGPLSFFKDKLGVNTYKSIKGASLQNVFAHAGDAARALGVSPDEGVDMLTVLTTGQRAENITDGWSRLTDKPDEVKALYKRVKARVDADPKAKAFMDMAQRLYKEYNDGLIDFLHAAGAITSARRDKLKSVPYAPWYRIDGDEVKLVTEREHPITIGNLKDTPELAELLGGDQKVMNLLDSSVRNTYMIARLAMRNKQQIEMVDALVKAGFVSKATDGSGPSGKDVIHYKVGGEDYWARIDKDAYGIPAEMIAQGMEGIKTTLPAVVKLMGIPAHWVRSFVTRTPAYAVRQLMRDPINSVFVNGMDTKHFLGAFRHMGESLTGTNETEHELMHSLVVTSNIYASNPNDVKKFVLQAAKGNANAVNRLLLKMDEVAQQADAATRNSLYEDSIEKGMSHAEASLRALESMNFNRRGLSPSVHMLSTMIPFFNAQVQGLDVLARSFSGKMPFNEQLELRQKMLTRGLMLMAATFAYAALMRDDEDYAKLKPQERYQNFHMRVPGVKDFVKIPIPYEFGAIFKALPEAILDAAYRDTKAKEAAVGIAHVFANSMPNLEPSAVAPIVMASLNYNGFGPIESHREQQLEPGMRYRDTTPEALKAAGQMFGVSPLMLEFFARSYTGVLGLGVLRVLGDPLVLSAMGKSAVPRPEGTEADTPFVGGLFQRKEGRFIIDRAYEDMEEIHTAQKTFDELVAHGEKAAAKKYAQEKSAELALAQIAGSYRREMGQLAAYERQVRNDPNKSPAQKDAEIKALRNVENVKSKAFYEGVEKTKARASRP